MIHREGFDTYEVTVDYVTSCCLYVEAESVEKAIETVEDFIQTEKGKDYLLRKMDCNRNVPDGLEVYSAYVAGQPVPQLWQGEMRNA